MTQHVKLPGMSQRKPGKPSISTTEAERVVGVLRRLYGARFHENKSELARALKISQPAVTQLLEGTNLPSLQTARAVARIEGVDVTSYLDEHAEDDDAASPFPSKFRAARSARGLDLPGWAIDQMLSEAPPVGLAADPGPMFWFRRIEQLLTTPRTTPDHRGNHGGGSGAKRAQAPRRRIPERP